MSAADRHDGEQEDNFGGAWLVTEYVFNPNGEFIGTVTQRRLVDQLDDGRLRVTQHCEPSTELDGHEMAAFAGTWVFDLEVHGDDRHYLGPDVVGMGTQWHPGAMTGQGLWPRFGYEFESYGVLVAPDRQLTGGFFSLAGRSVADIVGVAVPESLGTDPQLDLAAAAPELGDEWTLQRTVGPMRIGSARPAPNHALRVWTMHDTFGSHTISVNEDRIAGQPAVCEITIA